MSTSRTGWKQSTLLLILIAGNSQGFAFLQQPGKRDSVRRRHICAKSHSDSILEASLSAIDEDDELFIPGLLSPRKFNHLSRIDEALRNLQHQLDTLLIKPLTETSAKSLYKEDFQLLGPSREILSSSLQELTALSTTLVLATAATRQASLFVSSLAPLTRDPNGGVDSRQDMNLANRIDYQIFVENSTDWSRIGVVWNTNVTSMATLASTPALLEGFSILEFDSESGKIARHSLMDINLNGQPLNAIGEILATLRTAVRSFGQVPWLSPASSSSTSPFSFLSELRDSFLEQAVVGSNSSSFRASDDVDLPLYLVNSLDTLWNDTGLDRFNLRNLTKTATTPQGKSNLLPGTRLWKRYSSSHNTLTNFVKETIPKLSSVDSTATREELRNLFAPQAQLLGIDNRTMLLEGGTKLADFYRTLSTLRRTTQGTWTLEDARVEEDWTLGRVRVAYMATLPNPLTGIRTKIQGTDIFVLEDGLSGRIQRVEQVQLQVAGNPITDPAWYQRLITAVETATTGIANGVTVGGADWWMDLWQQATVVSSPTTAGARAKRSDGMLLLDEKAAATVYNLMASLHVQIANLAVAGKSVIPLADYVLETVELRGYLGEVLLRGKAAYLQMVGIALASLIGAIAAGRISWVQAPYASSVELTAQGTVKCSMHLPLQINSLNENFGLPAVPLDLELVSEYKTDERTGYIREHRLIESRVNGQLTPADVIPRWIKQWSSTNWKAPSLDGAETAKQALMDAISAFVQRTSGRSK